MAKDTAIGWTDHTFNISWGCSKISPGCENCYAERDSKRYGHDVWGPGAPRRTFGEKHWNDPVRWNEQAKKDGFRHRVFCSSMCDIFEDHPTITAERDKLWPLIAKTNMLIWQLLTKRASRFHEFLPLLSRNYLPNIWAGTSAENQYWAEKRMDYLMAVPSTVRFVSVEPMLGPVDLTPWLNGLHWVIVGGESGHNRRDHQDLPKWIEDLFWQCKQANVPIFVKQDSALKPGQQGRIPDNVWKSQGFPCV